jgi:hypothetical protein
MQQGSGTLTHLSLGLLAGSVVNATSIEGLLAQSTALQLFEIRDDARFSLTLDLSHTVRVLRISGTQLAQLSVSARALDVFQLSCPSLVLSNFSLTCAQVLSFVHDSTLNDQVVGAVNSLVPRFPVSTKSQSKRAKKK